jgi:hypothetical protein
VSRRGELSETALKATYKRTIDGGGRGQPRAVKSFS